MDNRLAHLSALTKGGDQALLRPADTLIARGKAALPTTPVSCRMAVPSSSNDCIDGEFILTAEFNDALKLIYSKAPFVFITGKAGTGKSTFVQLLKARLQNLVVVAPTGVAALNVGGQTIHSFFRIAPGPIDFDKIERLTHRRAYQAITSLIIDEVSMVRADLLDAIDCMLRRNASCPSEPFGGVQVIAVGDLYQLPPIVASEEEKFLIESKYESPFFFSAQCLSQLPIEVRELSHVFRQREENFIGILNNIRVGSNIETNLGLLNQQVAPLKEQSYNGVILTGDNASASNINMQKLAQLPSFQQLYSGVITGELRLDNQKLPAPLVLALKIGCQVMFVKNDIHKRWVNGTLGVVVELGDRFVVVEINEAPESRLVQVERQIWENLKYVFDPKANRIQTQKIGSYEQLPLMLAWAVTVHKSQGKSFEKVHVDLSRGAFVEGQVYVALSRCCLLAGLSLERELTRDDIRVNDQVRLFSAG